MNTGVTFNLWAYMHIYGFIYSLLSLYGIEWPSHMLHPILLLYLILFFCAVSSIFLLLAFPILTTLLKDVMINFLLIGISSLCGKSMMVLVMYNFLVVLVKVSCVSKLNRWKEKVDKVPTMVILLVDMLDAVIK